MRRTIIYIIVILSLIGLDIYILDNCHYAYFHNPFYLHCILIMHIYYLYKMMRIIFINIHLIHYFKRRYEIYIKKHTIINMNLLLLISAFCIIVTFYRITTLNKTIDGIELILMALANLLINLAVQFDQNQEVYIGNGQVCVGQQQVQIKDITSVRKQSVRDELAIYQIRGKDRIITAAIHYKKELAFIEQVQAQEP